MTKSSTSSKKTVSRFSRTASESRYFRFKIERKPLGFQTMLPLINRNLFLIPVQHNPESPALSVAAEPHAGTLPLAICLERYIHGKGKILYDFLGKNAAESSAVAPPVLPGHPPSFHPEAG